MRAAKYRRFNGETILERPPHSRRSPQPHCNRITLNPGQKTLVLTYFAKRSHRRAKQGPLLAMRPRRCVQARICPSAKASRYRVRLRPVSRRPACGSRRNAPRFTDIDRSLARPFPHRRYAYRVRGASPRAGPLLRRTRAHLAVVCALSEANFATFVRLNAVFYNPT